MSAHRIRSWVKKGVKAAVLVPAWLARDRRPGLVVLIYHRVGAGMPAEMDLPTDRFAAQMRHLRSRFTVVPLDEALDRLAAGVASTRDEVAITFDDGYLDVYTNAFPVLRDLDLPSTLFVATGFVDGDERAPLSKPNPGVASEAMSWDQIREMVAHGKVVLGSHSVTHRDFDTISEADAVAECQGSADVIEARSGRRPSLFAYPRAVVGHEGVVAQEYRAAVAGDGAKNHADGFVPMRVARTPVRDSDGMLFFKARLAGCAPLEDRIYAWMKARRKRSA